MRIGWVVWIATMALAQLPGAAWGEVYRVLEGQVQDAETDESLPLGGWFDASLFGPDPLAAPTTAVMILDDFEFEIGGAGYGPGPAIEFDGLTPILYIQIANQIHLNGDAVTFLRIRTGADLVSEDADQVVFRYVEFRADADDGGRAIGNLGASGFPRRLDLRGTLLEFDETFDILDADDCPVFSLPPAPPGGGVIDGGAGLEAVGGGALASIALPPPTLEELGITAPQGAVVTFDDDGVLTVTSEGDLIILGGPIDIPGLTAFVIRAKGSITVEGRIDLLDGVSLEFYATGEVDPESTELVIRGSLLCSGLRRAFPSEERELGRFRMLASAAHPIEIDVEPWRSSDRLSPMRRAPLPVGILGSEDFDVRDVEVASLRLGRGEASPLDRRRFWRSQIRDLNRDGREDLLLWFNARETQIAYGDTQLCVYGETTDGEVIEGCDAIDTRPRFGRGWLNRWSSLLRGR